MVGAGRFRQVVDTLRGTFCSCAFARQECACKRGFPGAIWAGDDDAARSFCHTIGLPDQGCATGRQFNMIVADTIECQTA